jgi:hypothetical protein
VGGVLAGRSAAAGVRCNTVNGKLVACVYMAVTFRSRHRSLQGLR